MNKLFVFWCVVLLFLNSNLFGQSKKAAEIIKASKAFHDPHSRWFDLQLTFYLVEPRIHFPERRSTVKLDYKKNFFFLERYYQGDPLVNRIVNGEQCFGLLDGHLVTDTALVNKFRLNCATIASYHNYYRFLLGIPMALNDQFVEKVEEMSTLREFHGQEAWAVTINLKERILAKNWMFYFNKENYSLVGISYQEESAAYDLVFRDLISIDGVQIPRIKNWYRADLNEFRGSDFIVKINK